MTKIKKSVANLLLSLNKPFKSPKVISSSDAMLTLLLYRRLMDVTMKSKLFVLLMLEKLGWL